MYIPQTSKARARKTRAGEEGEGGRGRPSKEAPGGAKGQTEGGGGGAGGTGPPSRGTGGAEEEERRGGGGGEEEGRGRKETKGGRGEEEDRGAGRRGSAGVDPVQSSVLLRRPEQRRAEPGSRLSGRGEGPDF